MKYLIIEKLLNIPNFLAMSIMSFFNIIIKINVNKYKFTILQRN